MPLPLRAQRAAALVKLHGGKAPVLEKSVHRILAITGFVAATIAPLATDAAPQTGRALPENSVKAVNVCMAASHPTNVNGKMRLRDSIEAVWYLLEGIRESPQPGSLGERLSTFPNPDPAEAEVNHSDAPQLINLCQQRWHNSHRGAIEIMLPVNMFRRNVQCYAIISFVKGMVSSDRVTDDDSLGIKIATKMAAYESRLSDRAFARHGIRKSSERDALLERRTFDALDLGNINDVVDACLKAPS